MNRKKILFVDDEENFTRLLKLNLEQGGEYEVMTENKGKNAFNSIRQFKPDLIFLDIMMPEVDGGDIAGQLRLDQNLKDIPVVFLTAIISREEVSSQDYIISGHPSLAKPVTKQQLIDCIKKNLKKS